MMDTDLLFGMLTVTSHVLFYHRNEATIIFLC